MISKIESIRRELVALKRSIDPHLTDPRRYEILRDDLNPIWGRLEALLHTEESEIPLDLTTMDNVDWISVDENLPDFRIYGDHCKDDQQNQIKVWFKRVNGSIILDIYQGWGIFGMGDGYKDVTHWLPANLKNPYKESK